MTTTLPRAHIPQVCDDISHWSRHIPMANHIPYLMVCAIPIGTGSWYDTGRISTWSTIVLPKGPLGLAASRAWFADQRATPKPKTSYKKVYFTHQSPLGSINIEPWPKRPASLRQEELMPFGRHSVWILYIKSKDSYAHYVSLPLFSCRDSIRSLAKRALRALPDQPQASFLKWIAHNQALGPKLTRFP